MKSYIGACILAFVIAGNDAEEMIDRMTFVRVVFFRKRTAAAIGRFLFGIVAKGIGSFLFAISKRGLLRSSFVLLSNSLLTCIDKRSTDRKPAQRKYHKYCGELLNTIVYFPFFIHQKCCKSNCLRVGNQTMQPYQTIKFPILKIVCISLTISRCRIINSLSVRCYSSSNTAPAT